MSVQGQASSAYLCYISAFLNVSLDKMKPCRSDFTLTHSSAVPVHAWSDLIQNIQQTGQQTSTQLCLLKKKKNQSIPEDISIYGT